MRHLLIFMVCFSALALGCWDELFYSELSSVNMNIEKAKEMHLAGNYKAVVDKLRNLDDKVISLANKYPKKHSELMPEFQLTIIYSLLSVSHKRLGEIDQSRRYNELFLERLKRSGIEKDLSSEAFISRILSN